ncbi:vanZ like family protein [Hirsutella rhossiliensis]|uniref:VanZ like family domain-containing protein n=1 Tax=Hirsutella rhossiliensis TaxID=111463 RepID=A0A9P8SED2_9HYPO|nr:vanZ like family domain-containing protein [Hirsutella rhossiliensis]KAH0959718.1 vanZ like family domain-containing protein [Hirsutella rhossiliensis]
MRIRLPFAGVFLLLLLLAGYAGLTTLQVGHFVNDKVLHTVTFFLLTVVFYWIVDTNRRRTLNMTLVVCTLALGVGSEFVQSFLPNDRDFDMYDIVANVVGSLAGVGLCSWYHRRMLERRRQLKTYNAVPGEDGADVELGHDHETGIVEGPVQPRTLEEEVDNWDENAADDWDGNGAADAFASPIGKNKDSDAPDSGDAKKRAD